MDKMLFTQVIPRLRVFETRLLDKAKLDRMIEAHSADEALKVLRDTEYANSMGDNNRAEGYEIMLSNELNNLYETMYDISPSKELIDVMSIKYAYHNIKVLLKGKFLNKDFSNMLMEIGMIDLSKLKYAVENSDYSELPKIMKESIEETIKDFEETKDPQRIDILLDKFMFKEMVQIAREIDDPFVEKYVKLLIDSSNLKALLRVKKQHKDREFFNSAIMDDGNIDRDMLLSLLNDSAENISTKLSYTNYEVMLKEGIEDYVAKGSSSLFEKLVDNYIMDMMKEAKFIPFGVEPVLAYIYAKETEIKVVRIIMVAKLNSISEEIIRERLREIYV